jgi:AraC-like DNA-binding protein
MTNPYVLHPRPHAIRFYELIWIFEGQGERVIDFKAYPVRPNRVFFMFPGPVHSWQVPERLRGQFVLFSEAFLMQAWRGLSFSELPFFLDHTYPPYLDLADATSFVVVLDQLRKIYETDHLDCIELLASYFRVLLLKLARAAKEGDKGLPGDAGRGDLVTQFKRLVENDFISNRQVADYAKQLYVTPNYLNQVIKSQTGKSAGEWTRDRLLLEAKRQLCHTQRSIQQIAQDLKFEDASYFCRFFKRYVASTPGQFRASQSRL